MKPRQKLFLLSLFSIYIGTILLMLIGFLCGIKVVAYILLVCVAVVLILVLALGCKPFIKARKLYSEKSPRAAYQEISSRTGYCRYQNMPPFWLAAVRCAEDPYFYYHHGVSPSAVFRAVAHNLLASGKKIGGSTITQQLVKNLYLTPRPTIERKITEMIMALRMERALTKKEILELYSNIIYFGNSQYGIAAAADFYYKCAPDKLSSDQCLSLAAILPCPDKYNEFANPVYFRQARQHVLMQMLIHYSLIAERLDESLMHLDPTAVHK